MSKKINNLYEFGEYRLDTAERVLYRKEQLLTLAPKVFETLLCFVESGGKIVSKEDLMNEVWQDSFVEESNLTQNIYTLRQIFGKRNKFIETVPRRGYRFTAEVKTLDSSEIMKHDNFTEIVISRKTTTTVLQEQIVENDEQIEPQKRLLKTSNSFLRSKTFRIGTAFGVFSTFLVGVFGVYFWQRNISRPSNALLEKVSFANLTDTGDVKQIAVSPDGQFLAFIKKDDTVWLKDINSKQDLPLKLGQEFSPQSLNFSPDGNSIYFLNRKDSISGAEIYKTTRFGGNAEFVIGNVWSEFELASDGMNVSFFRKIPQANEHQLITASLKDKSEKILVAKHFPEGFDLRSSPAWSSDSNEIYAISKPQERPLSSLVRVDVETGKVQAITTPDVRQFVSIIAMPDGRNLIATARERAKFPQIYKIEKTGGRLQRLTNDLNIYRNLTVSADGKSLIALQKNTFSHIWALPQADPAKAQQLTFGKSNRDGKHGVDLLPDGRIVFTSLEDLNRDLWTINPVDKSKLQLTSKKGDSNDRPFVAADGKSIFFSSLRDENYNIEKIEADGQHSQIITETAENELFPCTSPDGSILYFIRQAKGKSSILRRNLLSNLETEIPLPAGYSPESFLTISPDGRFLAFRQADIEKKTDLEEEATNRIAIGILNTDGDLQKAKTIEINTSQSQFRWNGSSDAIYFVSNSAADSAIWKQSVFESSEPQKVVELKDTRIYHFQFSRTGDLVISQGKHLDDAVLLKDFN